MGTDGGLRYSAVAMLADKSFAMARHRFCKSNDRDGFIEEFAEELWAERHGSAGGPTWSEVEPQVQREFRKLAAETLRMLEHGHG